MIATERPAGRATHWTAGPLTTWLVVLIAVVAAATMVASDLGIQLERGLQVWRNGLHPRAAAADLAFVEIDAKSLSRFDQWPWPRGLHARAIDALNRAGVRLIAFDVDFSSPSDPAQDRALAAAIARSHATIVLPTFRQPGSQSGGDMIENLPLPPFRAHAMLAAVNIYADGDGLVRSYPYGITTGGVPRPSMAAILADRNGRSRTFFAIDGALDPATIPRISFADLIDHPAEAAAKLRGTAVLIGASAIEMGDRYPVPGHGVLPGPAIQLLAANTLRDRSSPIDRGPLLPIALLLCLLPLAARAEGRRRILWFGAGGIAILLLPLAGEMARLGTVEVVPALTGLAAAAIATAMLATLRERRATRLVDLATGLPNANALAEDLAGETVGVLTVVRVANHDEVAGVLGQQRAADLIRRAAERLAPAAENAVYRVADGGLAWIIESGDGEEQVHRVDAAAALLRSGIDLDGRRIELRFAFGIADVRQDGAIAAALLSADRAVARGVRWERASEGAQRESDWRLGLASELDRAIHDGEIGVVYQPKLDIATHRIVSAEALVRWQHPTRGAIPPDAFIPALEDSGRIADLTLHVLAQALLDRARWASQGVSLGVAVNVSAQLPADEEFMARVEALLKRDRDALPHLTLEVTESAAITDPEPTIAALERLAALGVKLSIDDYGTGQSTLTYLKRLPAREIKIDKSFVTAIETSRSDQAMVRSSIELAHELGFRVVAEGVETAGAMALLAQFGCDLAQGWHVGRPMSADELARRTAETNRAAA